MANYKYSAKTQSGQVINGVVDADDQFDAIAKVKQTCPVILSIESTDAKSEKVVLKLRRMKDKELSLMCDRFSTLINVGLPIVDCLDMLSRQMEDKQLSAIIKDIGKDVSLGQSLYKSMRDKEGVFPTTFLESVKSGEETGELGRTFERLKSYYEKNSKTKSKVVSSLTYPAVTMVVAVVVIIIIMVVAVPTFSKTFASMGTEMPAPTKMLIAMSDFFINNGFMLLIAVVALVVIVRLYMRTEKGAEMFGILGVSAPVVGKIVQLSAASQFAHTMSMMLASGMPILRCLETAGKGMSNYVMRRDILAAIEEVEEGKSLGNCLAKSQYIPPMLVEMITMGEATGTLETTLEAVGNFYDNEVDIATTRATSLLEPAIVGVLAVVVVFILFSVYLPMFSMYGGM